MSMPPPPIITLLTDFGEHDGYVGAMKGVMLGIAPHVQFVDISHQVPPQDVRQAAQILSNVYTYFPPHTVHLVVVDPGVGSSRRPIALETPRGRFVAPDNGVLTYVQMHEESWSAILLDKPEYWLPTPSHTFHGRDVFSPVAAHLAKGAPFQSLGTPLVELVRLQLPALAITSTGVRGEVIHVDRFGNVLTNILRLRWLDPQSLILEPPGTDAAPVPIDAHKAYITCGWRTLRGLHRTYGEVDVGQALALVGSGGELEIAINQGNASETLAIKVGDPITLHFGS